MLRPTTLSPLKITDIKHPNATNILNKWADTNAQLLKDQASQLKILQAKVDSLSASSTTSSSNTSTSSSSSPTSGGTTDATSFRAFATVYQNTSSSVMLIHGYGSTSGSAWVSFTAKTGPTLAPSDVVWSTQIGATTAGAPAGFLFPVAPGMYYQLDIGGSGTITLTKWYETTL